MTNEEFAANYLAGTANLIAPAAGEPASYREAMDLIAQCLYSESMRTYHLESEVLGQAIMALAPEATKDQIEAALAGAMADWDL